MKIVGLIGKVPFAPRPTPATEDGVKGVRVWRVE